MNACTLNNGQRAPLFSIPYCGRQDFSDWILAECAEGARLCSLFALPEKNIPAVARIPNAPKTLIRLIAILARQKDGLIAVASTGVSDSYPALTPILPAAHLFERVLHEDYGLTPLGHPCLKPVRFPHEQGPRAGDMPFYALGGDDVHEVAVGPVHAGVIEPGHFRFQCLGETVLHLEISLGYQHRSIERALEGGPRKNTFPVVEAIAGDTSIGHTWAACGVIEGLSGHCVSQRAQRLRAVLLELERLANHSGDLGALSGDVGFLPTAAYCGRIRGDFLNMTASICGNRFGKNILRPGGLLFDIDKNGAKEIADRLKLAYRDVRGAGKLFFDSTSVTARMMGVGIVPKQTAADLGMVGPVARASNLRIDARRRHPLPGLESFIPPLCVENSGDIQARASVRMQEIKESAQLVKRLLEMLPEGEVFTPCGRAAPASFAVSLVEGWRGEICHAALTDDAGQFLRYSVTDPSFHNWIGLALAMRNESISDFPLCNKSFNLSYCGQDL